MRAIWKGAVSFGLVSIGVKLYAATEEKAIRFHQVHREDAGRIRYQRVCSVCGRQVSYDDIAKGYDLGGGEMVVLTDEDFQGLPLSTSRTIDVLQFVPAEQIDPIMFHRAYYLEPEGTATKPYVLLRDALSDSKRVAVVKVALRQKEQLATLRVRDSVLVLNTMLWPDEVREPDFDFLDQPVEAREPELAMAGSLIDSMTGDFVAEEYTDNYRAALQEVIDAKAAGREVSLPAEPAPAPAVDLMAALQASVERAQAARRDDQREEASGEPAEPTPITAARSRRTPDGGGPDREGAGGDGRPDGKRDGGGSGRKRGDGSGSGGERGDGSGSGGKRAGGKKSGTRSDGGSGDGRRSA